MHSMHIAGMQVKQEKTPRLEDPTQASAQPPEPTTVLSMLAAAHEDVASLRSALGVLENVIQGVLYVPFEDANIADTDAKTTSDSAAVTQLRSLRARITGLTLYVRALADRTQVGS